MALSFASPLFLTRTNLLTLLDQAAVFGIVAVGMTFVVLTGGIDLSVGAIAGLAGIVLGLALQHVSVPLACLAAVAVGAGARAGVGPSRQPVRARGLRGDARA